jgi:hypothetical protein
VDGSICSRGCLNYEVEYALGCSLPSSSRASYKTKSSATIPTTRFDSTFGLNVPCKWACEALDYAVLTKAVSVVCGVRVFRNVGSRHL